MEKTQNDIQLKQRCLNCIHASNQFKLGKTTHVHCQNPELFPASEIEKRGLSAWDTLRTWWDKCKKHEFIKAAPAQLSR